MAKSKRDSDLNEIAELSNHFKTVSDEQLLKMKYSPKGFTDKVFKRALNQELTLRGLPKV
jgi:hypothetical protein